VKVDEGTALVCGNHRGRFSLSLTMFGNAQTESRAAQTVTVPVR